MGPEFSQLTMPMRPSNAVSSAQNRSGLFFGIRADRSILSPSVRLKSVIVSMCLPAGLSDLRVKMNLSAPLPPVS